MRNGKTEKTDALVARFVASAAFKGKKAFRTEQIFYYWAKIVGDVIAAHVEPVRLDFHTLYLTADTPVWATELRYMLQKIIDKINAFVACEVVREIRFSPPGMRRRKKATPSGVYRVSHDAACFVQESAARYPAQASDSTPEHVPAIVRATCDRISDDKLKLAILRAVEKSEARKAAAQKRGVLPCPKCGAPNQSQRTVRGDRTLCPVCAREVRLEKRRAIRQLLTDEPAMYYYEVARVLQCSPHEVMDVRREMLQALAARLCYGDETSDDAKRFVMLAAQVKGEQLTKERIHAVLERYRFDLLIDWEKNPPRKSPLSGKKYRKYSTGGQPRT